MSLSESQISPLVARPPFLERLNRALYAFWKIPYPGNTVEEAAVANFSGVEIGSELAPLPIPSSPSVSSLSKSEVISQSSVSPQKLILPEKPFLARIHHIKHSKPKMSYKLGRRRSKQLS